jgi:hypothetical protein
MVEKLDAEELTGGSETPGNGDVLGARLRITPDGWLWAAMIAAEPARIAGLNTSRG